MDTELSSRLTPERSLHLPKPDQILKGIAENTRGAARWFREQKMNLALTGILTASTLMAFACNTPQTPDQGVKPPTPATEPARATATPVPVGDRLPTFADPNLTDIGVRLANPATRNQVPEEQIIEWNNAVLGLAQSGAATAESAKPTTTTGAGPTPPPTEAPATVTATVAAINTPEAKKDIPCTIVPEKYCSQGELIYTKNYLGQPEIYVGFHIPANEPFFAGKDGQVLKAKIGQPSALQGLLATIRDPNLGDPNATAYDVVGDLRFDNMSTVNAKKGDIVGYTQDTGIKNFGDYNLLVTIRRLDPSVGHAVPAEDLLRKLFPEAFKAVKTVDYQGPDKPAPTILSPVFASGK